MPWERTPPRPCGLKGRESGTVMPNGPRSRSLPSPTRPSETSQTGPHRRSPEAIMQPMLEKRRKPWYRREVLQGALVASAATVGVAFFGPKPTPPTIVVQPPPAVVVPPARLEADSPTADSGVTRTKPFEPVSTEEEVSRPVSREVNSREPGGSQTADLSVPRKLAPGDSWFVPRIATAVAVDFRETLGSRYVEVTVTPPGGASTRFPARSPGGSHQFSAYGIFYEVQVLAIDWRRSKVDVVVRPASNLGE
jgi:hypothetical protein